MDFLELLKQDYVLWSEHPDEYRKKVETLSDLFKLKGEYRFISNFPPSGITGNFDRKGQYVIFSLNPGYNKKFNPLEMKAVQGGWEIYLRERKALYLSFFKENDHPSNYYQKFWLLFSNLSDKQISSKWDFFDKRITNLNLIYYHSEKFSLPSRLTDFQLRYLSRSLENTFDFIQNYEPKLLIFNGKPWETLLIKNKFIVDYSIKPINSNFKLYFFKVNGIPSVLFEKFFSRHFWLTDFDRSETIPKLIQQEFQDL